MKNFPLSSSLSDFRPSRLCHVIAKPVKEVTADNSLLPTLELKELVVDMPCAPEKSDEDYSRVAQISNPKPTKVSHLIENISISINSRIGVNIGKCDVTTLSALIREMEVSQ